MIELYCTVCHYYDTGGASATDEQQRPASFHGQRMYNDMPFWNFSGGMFAVKSAYTFVKDCFPGWFPHLPGYQAFNYRVCLLICVFKELCGLLISGRERGAGSSFPLDFLPVFVANEKRSGRARVARGLRAKSYRASQNKWYYGVKVHVLGRKAYQALPNMMMTEVTPANESDISVAMEMPRPVHNITAFADKAYGGRQ